MNPTSLPPQIINLSVIFVLIFFPKVLQRYKIPAPLTSFSLGAIAAVYASDYAHNTSLQLFAILGISSLFLFAGLQVNLSALRKGIRELTIHLVIRSFVLLIFTIASINILDFSWQASALLGLALLTPSTGFILDSLPNLGLNEKERFWISSKAISGELLALLLLLIILKSDSYTEFSITSLELIVMMFGLPILFKLLNRYVIPYAPSSEFSLLVMVGVIAAYFTKQLGVYYLVGAFITGFVASQLREKMPDLASDDNLHAIRLFASFFVPFYFFYSGMKVPEAALQWNVLWLGLAMSFVILPLRIGTLTMQRMVFHRDSYKSSMRIAVSLAPTLVFTLVLARILHEKFDINDTLYGALLVYAGISTLLPSYLLAKEIQLDIDTNKPLMQEKY